MNLPFLATLRRTVRNNAAPVEPEDADAVSSDDGKDVLEEEDAEEAYLLMIEAELAARNNLVVHRRHDQHNR